MQLLQAVQVHDAASDADRRPRVSGLGNMPQPGVATLGESG
jgi:hypothetical protein